MLRYNPRTLPHVMRNTRTDRRLVSPVLMIVCVRRRRTSVHPSDPILAVVPIAVYAVVCDIPYHVIRVVHRRFLPSHARDLVCRDAAGSLKRDRLNLIPSACRVPYPSSIAPPVVCEPPLSR